MIINDIVAEECKYYTNTISYGDLSKISISDYLNKFFIHAKNSEEFNILYDSLKINSEYIQFEKGLENKEYEFIKKSDVDGAKELKNIKNIDDIKLHFVYSSYSNLNYKYHLAKDETLLNGIECKEYEVMVKEDKIPFVLGLLENKLICDSCELKIINIESELREFFYPEFLVFVETISDPILFFDSSNLLDLTFTDDSEVAYFEELESVKKTIFNELDINLKNKLQTIYDEYN